MRALIISKIGAVSFKSLVAAQTVFCGYLTKSMVAIFKVWNYIRCVCVHVCTNLRKLLVELLEKRIFTGISIVKLTLCY